MKLSDSLKERKLESITYMSASAIQRKIMAKEISPIEVMDHFIARIEKRNASINALVDVDFEGARAQAKEAEGKLMAGEARGAFSASLQRPRTLRRSYPDGRAPAVASQQ